MKPSELFSGSLAVSGTIRGYLLHLTGGGNGITLALDLLRSNEGDFGTQVASLIDQGRQINEARTRRETAQRLAKNDADRLASLQLFTRQMIAFSAKADTQLHEFAPAEQRYRNVTERMRGALARQQSIYGGSQAINARIQIFVAINHESIDANQLHTNVQLSYQNFDNKSGELLRDFMPMNLSCHGVHTGTAAAPAPIGRETWNSACLGFVDVSRIFQERVSALREACAHIEGVLRAEHREQEAMMQVLAAVTR